MRSTRSRKKASRGVVFCKHQVRRCGWTGKDRLLWSICRLALDKIDAPKVKLPACPARSASRKVFPVSRKSSENPENKSCGSRIVSSGHPDGGSMGLTTADHGRIDPAVVAALYEQHANELRLFLTGVLRDADLAAEALQNTFTKAVASGHTAREESMKSWLFQVGFHEAL